MLTVQGVRPLVGVKQ